VLEVCNDLQRLSLLELVELLLFSQREFLQQHRVAGAAQTGAGEEEIAEEQVLAQPYLDPVVLL